MRIISGSRRGHKLYEFEGSKIRPTTDRVKESLFNLIQDFVQNSDVLDAFCGSGALAFEALSRGAKSAVCLDIDSESIALADKNAAALKFEGLEIKKCDANEYLANTDRKFSLIFLDPPYNRGFIEPVIEKIVGRNLLTDDGIIVLESDNSDCHCEFSGLSILKQKRYGRTYITIYQRG